jgi:two-component system catabolic regulation response regulator CreB
MPRILIVEDEPAIADTLIYALHSEGHDTHWLTLAGAALDYQRATPADLIILDVGLPDIDGFAACRQLRQFSEVPVIFLTARNAEIDRLIGLEIGADDYVLKPFSPREVAARVRSILRRVTPASPAAVQGALHYDEARQLIQYQGQALPLTRLELRLLACLLAQPQRVFSREQLLEACGVAAEAGYERNVDSHIKSLRAKLRQVDPASEVIVTHRGLGYSLRLV